MKSHLIFGSHGSVGEATVSILSESGAVFRGPRSLEELIKVLDKHSKFDSVIWAQGINLADSIQTFDLNSYDFTLKVNTTFILETLALILKRGKIGKGAQLVVISSIWGEISRPEKLSYTVSKAASKGVVKSLAIDLGSKGISVNLVSPGPIDNPMTAANLSDAEAKRIISETPLGRFVTAGEVAKIISLLAEGQLKGFTGHEFVIDGGWTGSKLV